MDHVSADPDLHTLLLSPGWYRSGDLHLRSNCRLHLAGGAVLQASDRADDIGDPAHGGFHHRRAAFINALSAHDLSITGHGHIDGNRKVLDNQGYYRDMVSLKGCRSLRIDGPVFSGSCNWNTHLRGCEDVLVNRLKVLNNRPQIGFINTDGLNPDCCRRVTIQHCLMHTGDDAVAVKSCGDEDGWLGDVADITVTDLLAINNSATAKIGTETCAARMERIRFERIDAVRTARLCVIDGFDLAAISDVTFRDMHLNRLDTSRPGSESDGRLIDLHASAPTWREVKGRSRIENVLFQNIHSEVHGRCLLTGLNEEFGIRNCAWKTSPWPETPWVPTIWNKAGLCAMFLSRPPQRQAPIPNADFIMTPTHPFLRLITRVFVFLLIGLLPGLRAEDLREFPSPLRADQPVRGWMILSDNVEKGLEVIERASAYDINHLQLSHHIIHNLAHVRDERRRNIANTFTKAAHEAGIQEVVLWDHVLHHLGYYPDEFRTGPNRTLDFDNPAFWQWFKNDYREKLDLVPDIQGLILTFIETGARAERQHSEKLTTNAEKLAAVVNAVADVVIEERGLNLYARTFAYTDAEYKNITGAIALFENDNIRLMMKETPHDFFLTHPNDSFVGEIARPTIVEFDMGNEFNGQGILANTWPRHVLNRWSDFLERDQVAGYVARTDRYGDTRVIGRSAEINLWALKRYFEDRTVSADDIYREFISMRFGEAAYADLRPAFEKAFDIITASLYTLGTNTANHSRLNYDPYSSSYARHVSGKWLDPSVVFVEHGVDREFHYWKEVINHIAPRWAKAGGAQLNEIPKVIEAGWLEPGEKMNERVLRFILTQKDEGMRLAAEALAHVRNAREHLSLADADMLEQTFERTWYTARLHRAVSATYFGFRIYARGEDFRSEYVVDTLKTGLKQIGELADAIERYPHPGPTGQYSWVRDTRRARQYVEWIHNGTWPEKTHGHATGLNGIRFPEE